jgi:hypothetical protein
LQARIAALEELVKQQADAEALRHKEWQALFAAVAQRPVNVEVKLPPAPSDSANLLLPPLEPLPLPEINEPPPAPSRTKKR